VAVVGIGVVCVAIIYIGVNAALESAKKYGGGVKGDNCPAEKEAQNSLTKHIL